MASLVNTTPVSAELCAGTLFGDSGRLLLLTAKATFAGTAAGLLTLERENPAPLRTEDERSDLGLIPSDRGLRDDGPLEVFVYGRAQSPGGRPVRSMTVSVRVGDRRGHLTVLGDRRWRLGSSGFEPGLAAPFVSMPIVWERAYGGKARVDLSATTRTEFSHSANPTGVGFLPFAEADALRSGAFEPGFPRFEVVGVPLPNLLAEGAGFAAPGQPPRSCAWGPLPSGSSLFAESVRSEGVPPLLVATHACRSHPAWRIERPTPGTPIYAEGFSDEPWSTALPRLRVVADFRSSAGRGKRDLRLQTVSLYPNERRLILVYRRVVRTRDHCVSFRLRLEEGAPTFATEARCAFR